MLNDGRARRRRIRLQNPVEMPENGFPAVSVFEGSVGHDPNDFPNQILLERGANEVGDRDGVLIPDPPHIVMRIDMHQHALPDPGITPDMKNPVMVLHQGDMADRVDPHVRRMRFPDC